MRSHCDIKMQALTSPLPTTAPGLRQKPEREEPSLVIAGQGQGEPPTQGSGESIVVECGHPPGDPGPSSDHQDPPETCKSRRRRRRKKPSVAEGEQAALPPEAPRGAEEQGESRAKAPGLRQKPEREEPSLVIAGQGQGEPPTQGSAPGLRQKPEREEPSLVIAGQGQGEPPTQGSGESIVVECGHPPGDPGPSSDHQDPPETCKSRGRRRRKKPSVAEGEQAALPPEAPRGAEEQGESRAKAPGLRQKPEREEPSLVIAGQGQGEPPTQGSGESIVVECGHPPGDPGPSSDHQDPPETWGIQFLPLMEPVLLGSPEISSLDPAFVPAEGDIHPETPSVSCRAGFHSFSYPTPCRNSFPSPL
ncbi:hypothetical protein HJG60_010113 [Phyllostomus discolor]|uniref:Uncharacterized protein n=1 Tax=Phyllostomus discolor TaxID=89673 RepID=A0A834AXN9_9CHIR|nr:hypothetical protein HJG60_010113 [Phyllostomus discolor]